MEPPKWGPFKEWEKFVEEFCKTTDGGELLNAPVGPILLETISNSSSVKDILKSHRGDIVEEYKTHLYAAPAPVA